MLEFCNNTFANSFKSPTIEVAPGGCCCCCTCCCCCCSVTNIIKGNDNTINIVNES